jgi:phosphatase NudJ
VNIKLKNNLDSNELKHPHGDEQFKPNTTVAAIIHNKDKFLLVEEVENGKIVYNQPAGHLEAKESLVTAVRREILEETGLSLTPEYLSGIYYFFRADLNLYFIRFCFVIELEEQLPALPKDDEILATHWLSFEEIQEKREQLRSAMVLECIEDYLSGVESGKKIPLTSLKTNL